MSYQNLVPNAGGEGSQSLLGGISGSGISSNAYVAEDGTTPYVAEDGTTPYVAEDGTTPYVAEDGTTTYVDET